MARREVWSAEVAASRSGGTMTGAEAVPTDMSVGSQAVRSAGVGGPARVNPSPVPSIVVHGGPCWPGHGPERSSYGIQGEGLSLRRRLGHARTAVNRPRLASTNGVAPITGLAGAGDSRLIGEHLCSTPTAGARTSWLSAVAAAAHASEPCCGPTGARVDRWSACPVVVAGRGHPGTGHRASQPQQEPGSRRFRT